MIVSIAAANFVLVSLQKAGSDSSAAAFQEAEAVTVTGREYVYITNL